MAKGRKTGGRKKGTPNKRSQTVTEKLEALGCDPIAGMARIAMNTKNPIELRAQMFKELAQYIAPKRKAIELHEEIPAQSFVIRAPAGCESIEEWERKYSRLARQSPGPSEPQSRRDNGSDNTEI
jgi:hypothetical protein